MTWAQRLKRVFNIDIETCNSCGGPVKIIACIEELAVIEKILRHLERKDAAATATRSPPSRAPPQGQLVRLMRINHASMCGNIKGACTTAWTHDVEQHMERLPGDLEMVACREGVHRRWLSPSE